MSEFRNHPFYGYFLALFGTCLFSFKSIFIKLAYAQGLNTDSVLVLRMAISLPIYLAFIIYLYQYNKQPINDIKNNILMIIFLGFISYFLASWFDLKGLEYISAGLERLTLFTYPIFVAILGALFFKTPISRKIIVALALSYLGVWIAFNQELNTNSNQSFTGIILVLLSALSYSVYVLLSKKMIHKIGSLWFTSVAMTFSSLFVLTYYTVFIDFSRLNVTASAWLWVSSLALISTVLPSFMISEAIVKIGPAPMSIVGTLGPVITIVLAALILEEPFNLNSAFGIIFVISGIMYLTKK